MITDKYARFEDLTCPETHDFAATAHAKTQAHFCQDAEFERLQADITAQLQDERQIPFCQEHHGRMYHFHQSADYPKGVYRVCTSSSYRTGLPDWQILFDVADFDEVLDDDIYLDGVSHYVEQPNRVLLTLSQSGADSAYTLEFDLASGSIVEEGFHFPAGKNHIAWRDENSVWVCPAWDERQLTHCGYPCQVWLIERGQSFAEGTPVYKMSEEGMMVNAWRYLDPQGTPIDLIEAASGFFSKTYFQVAPDCTPIALKLPENCDIVGYIAGQLLVQLRSNWARGSQIYRSGSLLAIKLNREKLGAAKVLFEPNQHQAIDSVETTKRFVVLSLLDNVSGSLKAWRFEEGQWLEESVPALPQGALELVDQPWGGDIVYIASSDFTTPLTLFSLDLHLMELVVLRRQPKQFDATGIQVRQFYTPSADGTPIPYYHVGRCATPDTPTLVYVYGGFGMAELPHYLGTIGRHWLAEGHAFVLANVRGGGEFGPEWHQAAQGVNKHKSVDDLLAVVHDVSQRGLSSPSRIALQGGSNGGLVVASAFVREPEAIGAMVCEVPLTDMLRYADLSAGSSWLEEYGDPKNLIHFEALAKLSPYHHLNEHSTYSPALITTALSDDRVHPAHALKFYAKLNEISSLSWLYAPFDGGHAGNGTQEQTAIELACVLRFLQRTIAEFKP